MDMRRGEERVRCMERVTWKHITICKIDSQLEFAVWLRKLKQGLYQSREVGRGGIWEGGSQGKGYMYIDSASLVAQMLKRLSAVRETWFDPWVRKIPWRSKWQPSPVLLPGKSHRRRSLVGYSPWGCKESDTTEQLHSLSFYG